MFNKLLQFLMATSICIMAVLWIQTDQYAGKSLVIYRAKDAAYQLQLAQFNDLAENSMICSYKASKAATITRSDVSFAVTQHTTNDLFQQLWHYPTIVGSYFTQSHYNNLENVVVMNEACAFSVFGGFNAIGEQIIYQNEYYELVGIIGDGQKDNHIYMPYLNKDQSLPVDSVYALIDSENGITSDWITNQLTAAGIDKNNSIYLETDTVAKLSALNFQIAVCLLLAAVCLNLLMRFKNVWIQQYRAIKLAAKDSYIRELIQKQPQLFINSTCIFIVNCFLISIIFMLFVRLTWFYLEWKNSMAALSLVKNVGSVEIEKLLDMQLLSLFAIALFLIIFVLLGISIYTQNKKTAPCKTPATTQDTGLIL